MTNPQNQFLWPGYPEKPDELSAADRARLSLFAYYADSVGENLIGLSFGDLADGMVLLFERMFPHLASMGEDERQNIADGEGNGAYL